MSNTWLKRHPLSTYFVLAYAISWIVAVPLALQAQGITHTQLPFTLHYLMAFGPALAARAVASLLHELLGGAQRKLVVAWAVAVLVSGELRRRLHSEAGRLRRLS
jgi:hypothetical protein